MTSECRVQNLEAIHNFRDYGGYRGQGGGQLRRGLLWRSAQHHDASTADLRVVDSLQLGAVIDLRGDSERAAHPCKRGPGFSAHVLFAEGETAGTTTAPHLAAADGVISGEQGAAALRHAYQAMPWQPNLVAAFQLYFKALEVGAPTLVHCFAGKDRTGVIVALFHHLMGVHPDDILADYMLTNQTSMLEERIASGAKHIRSRYGNGITDDGIRALMMVQPDYLATAIGGILAQHSSIEAYAQDVLGIDATRLAALRALYLV